MTLTNRPGLVAVVSDFRDQHDWVRPLTGVAARHCAFAVEVCDPREATLPSVGRIALVDPESGRRVEVDTSSARVRARFEELEQSRRDELAADLRRLHVPHVPVGTDEDWLLALARGLSSRQRGRAPRMSFYAPLWLFALLLVPVALGVQRLARRRARRFAMRFPAVPTVVAALGTRPDWRRHLPVVAMLAAVSALAIALARPHVTTRCRSGRHR